MFTNRGLMMMPELFRRELGDWFSNVAEGVPGMRGRPALNIWEDGDNVIAEAELPGFSMEEIEVYVVGNELTLRGQRRENEHESANFHRRERATGEFARTVTLPFDINSKDVDATLKNGVLTVTMPKAEAAKPRKINVKA